MALYDDGPAPWAADWGLVESDFAVLPAEVFPDNWDVIGIFTKLNTQWLRAGMQGAVTGLNYAALPAVFDMCGVKRKRWPEMFDDIRVMERAALDRMNEQNDRNKSTA